MHVSFYPLSCLFNAIEFEKNVTSAHCDIVEYGSQMVLRYKWFSALPRTFNAKIKKKLKNAFPVNRNV